MKYLLLSLLHLTLVLTNDVHAVASDYQHPSDLPRLHGFRTSLQTATEPLTNFPESDDLQAPAEDGIDLTTHVQFYALNYAIKKNMHKTAILLIQKKPKLLHLTSTCSLTPLQFALTNYLTGSIDRRIVDEIFKSSSDKKMLLAENRHQSPLLTVARLKNMNDFGILPERADELAFKLLSTGANTYTTAQTLIRAHVPYEKTPVLATLTQWQRAYNKRKELLSSDAS